ncbi:hypothetical protein DICPUDRAFT_150187 [Dictyostelium purpureum]|uniref:EF-hand domain-containing protein n=1 Tax=Dictyostelium purpureum TaxID=5786 RepID=F0ZFN6_DICPU|nr:uncharacterized protein DICPUDRAFT_150187 [Dictyostelium purpureum]EGC37264.1 hypothetical protein DICPUDRAFT_150187 [Dictyostelium purpureum]|eukprot:XP_003286234.1 hypothetical protein DICPUDRAFT_150187 [Dictyostelium purpureum]
MGQSSTKLSKDEMSKLMTKTKYSKEDVDRLAKDFIKYSGADKKEGFSETEFIDFFGIRFKDWDKDSMKLMFKAFDSDGNGNLDFKEFTTALYLMTKAPVEEKLGALFDIFDEDRSGTLSQKEVEKMVTVACHSAAAICLATSENIDYAFSLFRDVYIQPNGLSKDQFIKVGKASDKFIKMICFYDTVGNLLY